MLAIYEWKNPMKLSVLFHEKDFQLHQVYFDLIICQYLILLNLAKSRATNPRTPYNSSAGDARRTNPSLPLIRRAMNSSVATVVNESTNRNHLFISIVSVYLRTTYWICSTK